MVFNRSLRVHDRSARPGQPRDQRCFEGPNGILMFKHRGREEGEAGGCRRGRFGARRWRVSRGLSVED